VLASTLLGTEPPVLRVGTLVRAGEVFGLSEGSVRTALSRMAAAGELVHHDDGRYELAGHLVERQSRQRTSRGPTLEPWDGTWELWIVVQASRPSPERAELRRAARSLRLAELREGVWVRPANLDPWRSATAGAVVRARCRRFVCHTDADESLVPELWDLAGWSTTAGELRRALAELGARFGDGEVAVLREGFLLSAAVLRHLNDDPLLPRELLPRRWEGERLRADYDRWDAGYRELLADWLRAG
jgi:phenylacetic acid degradation operon negative regulatory protein